MLSRRQTPSRPGGESHVVRSRRRRRERSAAHRPQAARQPEKFGLRWVSTGLLLLFVILGVVIFASPAFYVRRAEIGGVRYVPAEEIFTNSGIAGYHILWVDPGQVAEQVAASPSLSFAQVIVQWPARVVILVREREPALIWEQQGAGYWVDVNGNLMLMRSELPNLVRVVNEGEEIPFQCPGPACEEEGAISIQSAVVLGALQLKTLRSSIDMLYYDTTRGLSFNDDRGWRAYLGVGTDMDYKLQVYEQLAANLLGRGLQPLLIDVSRPDSPFYRVGE